jgi:hypothetical protein
MTQALRRQEQHVSTRLALLPDSFLSTPRSLEANVLRFRGGVVEVHNACIGITNGRMLSLSVRSLGTSFHAFSIGAWAILQRISHRILALPVLPSFTPLTPSSKSRVGRHGLVSSEVS